MEDALWVTDRISVPRGELAWRFSHSGGPGGQSVNTADSRVQLVFDLAATTALPEDLKQRALHRLAKRLVNGALMVTASASRSQLANRRAAEERLAEILAEAIAPPPRRRRPTRPSRGAVEARLSAKRRRSQTKRDRRPTED